MNKETILHLPNETPTRYTSEQIITIAKEEHGIDVSAFLTVKDKIGEIAKQLGIETGWGVPATSLAAPPLGQMASGMHMPLDAAVSAQLSPTAKDP